MSGQPEWFVNTQLRRLVGEAIVAGYRGLPQTEAEVGWPDEATARTIGAEPW